MGFHDQSGSAGQIFIDALIDATDSSIPMEGETLPNNVAEIFYPVHIGEVFNSQYRVVGKLGYDLSSTA